MSSFYPKLLAAMLVTTLILTPFGANLMAQESLPIEEATPMKMTADLLLVRPLGFIATLVGGVIFIFGIPFSALGGNVDESFDYLLAKPAKYTFIRPLGDI